MRSQWLILGTPLLGAVVVAALLFGPRLEVFKDEGFMPHGHCYLWLPWLVRLHFWTDMAIGLSYVSISFTLTYLVWAARRDIPFGWMFLSFGVFIISCGATHFYEVYNLWHADYWGSGLVKAVTAAASVITAILLPFMVPKALALGSAARLAAVRKDELERANKALESYNFSVAHDLKAPLRHLDAYAAMLDAGGLPADQRELLKKIRSGAQRMTMIVESLLSLGRASRTPQRQAVDLSALAREEFGRLSAAEPGRRVETRVQPGLKVQADVELVRILLANLLGNAWKFTAGRDPAVIELGRKDDEFYVRDNGAGFDPARAGGLFTPFRRLHDAEEFPGTGIGLATVRAVVQAHGGAIRAESQPGKGATFYFTLG